MTGIELGIAAIGAAGNLGGAALAKPPTQSTSLGKADSGLGYNYNPFGSNIVYGGGQQVPTAQLTSYAPPSVLALGGGVQGGNQNQVLYLIGGGVLLWLLLKKR